MAAGRREATGSSARERQPHLVARFEAAAAALARGGQAADGGWLLVALVAPELRSAGRLDPDAGRLGRAAAELLAQGRARLAAARVAAASGDCERAAALLRILGSDEGAQRVEGWGGDRIPLDTPVQGLSTGVEAVADAEAVRRGARRALQRLRAGGRGDLALVMAEALGLAAEVRKAVHGLGDQAARAERLSQAGQALAAARAWIDAEQPGRALLDVVRVPVGDPEYREACVLAAHLATSQDSLGFELDHMLSAFVGAGPQGPVEVDAFRELAALYFKHGQLAAARELLDGALAARPDDPQALALSERLPVRRELRAVDALPELPELPELPTLPPMPTAAQPAPAGARPGTAADPRGGAATLVPPGFTRAPEASRAPGARPGHTWTPAPESGPADRLATAPPEHGPSLSPGGLPFEPGARIAGRYRIEAELGEGGMGKVFRVFDESVGDVVALKVLQLATRNPRMLERFRRELRLTRRLSHDNVVRVHDLGVAGGWPFITMELLEGCDLAQRLDEGPVSLEQALSYTRQAALGLQAAHDQDIVHRDIKSANLFLTRDGVIKVMDFGLARTQGPSSMTQVGMLAGSPAYMAPEQGASLGNATAASDQYALGVVCFELLTGSLPFRHDELLGLLRLHAEAPPPPPSRFLPILPDAVDQVVLRALSKRPADRFPSCRDFAQALAELHPGA